MILEIVAYVMIFVFLYLLIGLFVGCFYVAREQSQLEVTSIKDYPDLIQIIVMTNLVGWPLLIIGSLIKLAIQKIKILKLFLVVIPLKIFFKFVDFWSFLLNKYFPLKKKEEKI